MKKVYKVRKGLETPLVIKGMLARDYWVFVILLCLLGGILAFGLSAMFMGAMNWITWVIQLIVFGGGLFALLQYFLYKGKAKRYRFQKVESTLSNRDLLDYL